MIIYFPIEYVIKTHDKIIEISGGAHGVRDEGLIESVLSHVQNDDYYPTYIDKLTHIVFSLTMNHAFADGNKRSAIALGGFFLALNGYENRVGTFILEMENIVLWTAQKKVDKEFLFEIINDLINIGELSEKTKVELLVILEEK